MRIALDKVACGTHGGGKRCVEPGCGTAARVPTDKCKAHGGGSR